MEGVEDIIFHIIEQGEGIGKDIPAIPAQVAAQVDAIAAQQEYGNEDSLNQCFFSVAGAETFPH